MNSKVSFSSTGSLNVRHTKFKGSILPWYLPMTWGWTVGFISFLRVLAIYEMQTSSSAIWTRVPESIFHEDNHNTTDTHTCLHTYTYTYIYIYICILSSTDILFIYIYIYIYIHKIFEITQVCNKEYYVLSFSSKNVFLSTLHILVWFVLDI